MKRIGIAAAIVSLAVLLVSGGLAAPFAQTDEWSADELSRFERRVEDLGSDTTRFLEHEDPEAGPRGRGERSRSAARASASASGGVGLRIHIFDLGQADSALVVGPPPGNKTLLIDLGEEKSGDGESYLRVANRILEITGGSQIDYFVASHFHTDHVGNDEGGVAGLLDGVDPQFRIGTFVDLGEVGAEYLPDQRWTKRTLEKNLERWVESGTVGKRSVPRFGTGQIDLGGEARVEIVTFGGKAFAEDPGVFQRIAERWPDLYERAPGSENDISIGLEVSFGDFEYFTAGDLTGYAPDDFPGWTRPPLYTPRQYSGGKRETYTNVESHLAWVWTRGPAAHRREADVEVYRANHHGSRYSSSPEFLDALDPEFVLYSCGGPDGNGYGHPDRKVVERTSATAGQLLTDRAARRSYDAWRAAGGRWADEIVIEVAADGKSYRLEGRSYRAFSDDDEADGKDDGAQDRPL